MRRTDQALVYGGCGLDGNECTVRASSMRLETRRRSRAVKVSLGRIGLIVSETTGIHDGKVGPQAMTDILIGDPFMLEQLQANKTRMERAVDHGGIFSGTVYRNSTR